MPLTAKIDAVSDGEELGGYWPRRQPQLPLPLLLAGGAEIAPGVGVVTGEAGGLVLVHGLATFAVNVFMAWRLAAVQLVRLRAASPGEVAEASGWTRSLRGKGTRR